MSKLHTIVAVVALLLISNAPIREKRYKVQIYYFPLFSNTVAPITSKRIEELYDLTSVLQKSTSDVLEILRRKELSPSDFDGDQIRLKIILDDGKSILYDLNGNVKEGGKVHRLRESSRKELRNVVLWALPDG